MLLEDLARAPSPLVTIRRGGKRFWAQRAGLTAEWAKIVSHMRESHHRKMGFMSGFESLVAGSGPSRAPSFLERAKTTWGARQPRHGP